MDFPLPILLFEDQIIYVVWFSKQLNMATFGVKTAFAEIIWPSTIYNGWGNAIWELYPWTYGFLAGS